MITGFNTDVPHDGVTYHVQTEDKGLDTPLILSLVYVGGHIIASKRTPYEDLVGQGFDEKALAERLKRQHKLICAAIKAGRVEDLKRMSGPNGGAPTAERALPAEPAPPAPRKTGGQRKKKSGPLAPPAEPRAEEVAAAPQAEEEVAAAPRAEEMPAPSPGEIIFTLEEPIGPPASAAPPVEEPAPIPVEPLPAEEPVRRAPARVTTELDIEILTTLADELNAFGSLTTRETQELPAFKMPEPPAASAEEAGAAPVSRTGPLETPLERAKEIYLTLLDDEGEFRAGQLATIKVYVGRGVYGRRPEPGATVTVKVLGTAFRPILMTATTDAQGIGVVRALLPRFSSGRAAIIIRAEAGEESAEMRRIIHQ